MQKQMISKAVQASPFFRLLDISHSPSRAFEALKGDILSDLARSNVILVCSGEFEVYSSGKEVLLASLCEGDCFGINSLYSEDEEVESKILCRRKGVLLSMSKDECRRLLECDPKAMAGYAALCNEKIHFLLGRISELTVQSARDRVLSYLMSRRSEDGSVVLDRSRDALASMLNMSRAALFAQMATLQKEGIIKVQNRRILLLEQKGTADGAKEG